MNQVLEFDTHRVTPDAILPLLIGYRMLPQLRREMMIDAAIATIELTPQEQANALEKLITRYQLTTLEQRQTWLKHYGMANEQLALLAMRELKIEKFKQLTWGHRLESYFLTHKSKLDKVIYSILRTTDAGLAQELYFRIQTGEQSFDELARQYSQGSEAQTGGMLGPIELSRLHPNLAKLLSTSKSGQLWAPMRLDNWVVIVRLEKFIPAQLDDQMRQQLLDSLFESWLTEQINSCDRIATFLHQG